MNNIIAFPARSGSSVEIQESQLAEREVTTVKSQCAIDFGDLLKLPLDQWATKLDDIQHQLRTLNDPRTRTLEKGVENIPAPSLNVEF
uniref:Uncharacterized protein n=1 Tax=Rhodopseudomonas palustris (strain BisA53) TaxID=316055 RepID=Q07NT8_RHOP5